MADLMAGSVWAGLSEALRESEPYRTLREQPGRAVGLPVPVAAWVSGLLARDLERPVLVVVPRESEALRWVEAARLVDAEASVFYFPSPALTPYQEAETSLLVRAQESVALDRILSAALPVVVCTPRALFPRLPHPEAFQQMVWTIRRGAELPIEELTERLHAVGYRRSDLVAEVGVFAVRGGVFDLFPPGEPTPIRLDLFGDTVEAIRRFDTATQRSEQAVDEVRVLPLSLYRCGPEQAKELARRLEAGLGPEPGVDATERIESLIRGAGFPGWENYLPLLAETTTSLGHLIDGPMIVTLDRATLESELTHHVELLQSEVDVRRDQHRLAVSPEDLATPGPDVLATLEAATIRLEEIHDDPAGVGTAVDFGATSTDLMHHQLPRFPREVETARARGERLLLVSPSEHHESVREMLEAREVHCGAGGVELIGGELERGFRLPPLRVVVFGEPQLFARRSSERSSSRRLAPFLSGLRDLRVGEFIVHEDHGIGQFIGMRALEGSSSDLDSAPPSLRELTPGARSEVEVMEILYGGERSLLLPLNRLNQIQKYSGIEGAAPRLDRLGGSSWNRTKNRVKRGLRKLATDLLKLYAQREVAQAPAMAPDSDAQSQFEAAFEYEETPDQLEASAAIKDDLEQPRPMDRLLCGDVGFGKTEVAMRAAHKVVDSGYQVAVLAPTTILADQHLETFRRRFTDCPIEVEMISRFRSAAEVREIRERLAQGKVDILIGTHRLLSRDVEIPRLGLLVVDEEQRFGVAQKERFKELRSEVHVLAMSATPVPRTLQLSLAGVRDLSVIESPPKDRMAVETRILPFTRELVREALEFEIERSGQVYYVYNRVEGIEEMMRYLASAVPGLRVTVGHGQMDERELARRMHAFTAGEYDVLLATTIIENGIDIPNVNTMIVHRADRFGLAQLYQLRGRVGRSNQLAYCYLLVSSDQVLSEDAHRRLVAIREFTDLGAGFRIAARDLEIRGAGNLLGAEQSGHIAEVGIETYLKMLEETVQELQGEAPRVVPSANIDLPVPMSIPKDYIGDTNLRMDIYRRLGAGDEDESEVLAELRDRFGQPPEVVHSLVRVAELKRLAERLRVQSISTKGRRLIFRLRQDARIDVERLIRFVSERGDASFSPSGVLVLEGIPPDDSLAVARGTLETLSVDDPRTSTGTSGGVEPASLGA